MTHLRSALWELGARRSTIIGAQVAQGCPETGKVDDIAIVRQDRLTRMGWCFSDAGVDL